MAKVTTRWKNWRYTTLAVLPWLAFPPHASAGPAKTCGDLLKSLADRPAALVFVDCTYHPEKQAKPFEATYRVPGRDARAVEAYLRRTMHMGKLRFECCGWSAPPVSFRLPGSDSDNQLVMTSGETLARDWNAIPFFVVLVTQYTEEI